MKLQWLLVLSLFILIEATPPSLPFNPEVAARSSSMQQTQQLSAENRILLTPIRCYPIVGPFVMIFFLVAIFASVLTSTLKQLTIASRMAISASIWGSFFLILAAVVSQAMIQYSWQLRNRALALDSVVVTNENDDSERTQLAVSKDEWEKHLKKLKWTDDGSDMSCSICLDFFNNNDDDVVETCRYKSKCDDSDVVHVFHKKCWELMKEHHVPWFCPICRKTNS